MENGKRNETSEKNENFENFKEKRWWIRKFEKHGEFENFENFKQIEHCLFTRSVFLSGSPHVSASNTEEVSKKTERLKKNNGLFLFEAFGLFCLRRSLVLFEAFGFFWGVLRCFLLRRSRVFSNRKEWILNVHTPTRSKLTASYVYAIEEHR